MFLYFIWIIRWFVSNLNFFLDFIRIVPWETINIEHIQLNNTLDLHNPLGISSEYVLALRPLQIVLISRNIAHEHLHTQLLEPERSTHLVLSTVYQSLNLSVSRLREQFRFTTLGHYGPEIDTLIEIIPCFIIRRASSVVTRPSCCKWSRSITWFGLFFES